MDSTFQGGQDAWLSQYVNVNLIYGVMIFYQVCVRGGGGGWGGEHVSGAAACFGINRVLCGVALPSAGSTRPFLTRSAASLHTATGTGAH